MSNNILHIILFEIISFSMLCGVLKIILDFFHNVFLSSGAVAPVNIAISSFSISKYFSNESCLLFQDTQHKLNPKFVSCIYSEIDFRFNYPMSAN